VKNDINRRAKYKGVKVNGPAVSGVQKLGLFVLIFSI
jgi:hypothetical protein